MGNEDDHYEMVANRFPSHNNIFILQVSPRILWVDLFWLYNVYIVTTLHIMKLKVDSGNGAVWNIDQTNIFSTRACVLTGIFTVHGWQLPPEEESLFLSILY